MRRKYKAILFLKLLLSTPTTPYRIDFETMVIADPVSTIPAAAADADIVAESYTLGDCLTDTLTGNLDVFRLRNIALSSGCARDDVSSSLLRLQHGQQNSIIKSLR